MVLPVLMDRVHYDRRFGYDLYAYLKGVRNV